MAGKRRQFRAEFKLEAVRLANDSGKPISQVARELGIRADMPRTWKRQAQSRAGLASGDVFSGNRKLTSQEEEIRQLRREVEILKQEREILKKSGGLLRQGSAVKVSFIRAHATEYPIARMCEVLEVSKAGYYAWRKRPDSRRAREDRRLKVTIRAVHRKSRRSYGSPRVHEELRDEGIACGRKRVERLMREEGLRAKKKRRFRRTTDSAHAHPIHPNRLERHFAVREVEGVDRVWVSDITYLPTRQGWLYLAVVLDMKSRMEVGWAMQNSLATSLATDALTMALFRRKPGRGLLCHSDRGVQYAAGDCQEILRSHGITGSMSRKGNCWDNAVAESFFATLEWELIQDSDWHTHEEARRAVFDYIEVWYNRQRRHSSLGYRSPVEFERQLALTPRAA